jgi:hypothetical protein
MFYKTLNPPGFLGLPPGRSYLESRRCERWGVANIEDHDRATEAMLAGLELAQSHAHGRIAETC